ncbi:MAG: hypothetical protein DRJ37_04685 [Thermoprotei archaeon]|nr:MAG: hypothetical protein DRJ37_04685 [Thermoprotei archaeon]
MRKEKVFPRYISWMLYAPNAELCEFCFTIPNRPGQLRKTLEIFEKYGVNILSISGYALPEWREGHIFIFADVKNAISRLRDIEKELKKTAGEVYIKYQPVPGFMIDEFAHPVYVFPGVRSLIFLEPDFAEMIKGLYEKFGEIAATLLYHEAFSGGKFLAEYLSEKLGLDGKELLIECLKFYQAGGWGRVTLIKYDLRKPEIVLRLWNSLECGIFSRLGKPASHFFRGHLSGLLSGLLNRDIRFIERKCIAMGDPYCEFYLETLD